MAAGVGNGVGGMLRLACQLTGLFMPGTTVSVGIGVGTKSISFICRTFSLITGKVTYTLEDR